MSFVQIQKIIMEHLEVPESRVTPSARLTEDLGADSLDAVALIMAINECFSIKLPAQTMEKISTVEELNQAVMKLVQAR